MSDSPIDCPCCSSPMRPLMQGQTKLDFCSGCGGTWYDAGELEEVLGEAVAVAGAAPQYRECPRCRTQMKRGLIGKIGVERCASCEGNFLDGGELESIVGARRAEAARKAAAGTAAAPRAPPRPATFVCPKCRKSYPREKGYAVPGGFVCDGCSGLVVPREPSRFERFLEQFVESISANPRRHWR